MDVHVLQYTRLWFYNGLFTGWLSSIFTLTGGDGKRKGSIMRNNYIHYEENRGRVLTHLKRFRDVPYNGRIETTSWGLGESMGHTRQYMYKTLDRMEREGYVYRVRKDVRGRNRSSFCYYLTAKGFQKEKEGHEEK